MVETTQADRYAALRLPTLEELRLMLAAIPAPDAAKDAEIAALKNALSECAAQFAFYGIEHRKAGKIEKAETNERFFNIANNAIGRGDHSAKGNSDG